MEMELNVLLVKKLGNNAVFFLLGIFLEVNIRWRHGQRETHRHTHTHTEPALTSYLVHS